MANSVDKQVGLKADIGMPVAVEPMIGRPSRAGRSKAFKKTERESRGGGSGFPRVCHARRGVCVIAGLGRDWRPGSLAPGFHSLQFWRFLFLLLISEAAGHSNFLPTNTAKENSDFRSD